MVASLLELPSEVIILIVYHLPLRDIIACKQSCHRVRTLIKDSQLLQRHFQTMSCGVEDLFVPGICSSELLESLEQWEVAWRKVDIGERFARHRYHNILWTVEYVVQSGHVAAMRMGDSDWHAPPGWSYADISRVLIEGDEGPQDSELGWTNIQLGNAIIPKGYVLDVSQDLVVVAFYRDAIWKRMHIQFLRFTTGKSHDLASNWTFELDLKCKSPSDCEIGMEVMGSYLVMIVTHKTRTRLPGWHQRIYFVDWTRGYTHCVRRVPEGTYFPIIAFVSKDVIVLARKHDFSLEICNITKGKRNSLFTLRTVCVLKLPSLQPSARVRLQLRNRTPLAGNPSTPLPLGSSRLPFRSSPADAVLGFDIQLRRPGPEDRKFSFWVHHSVLRKYAAEAMRPPRCAAPAARNPRTAMGFVSRLVKRVDHAFASAPARQWHEWGPQSTRWRECSDEIRDRQTLAGTRCAVAQQGSLLLMDFNPGRLAKLRAQGPSKDPSLWAVVNPTVISAGRFFRHDIISRLPYCASVNSTIKNRVLMDDEWVLQFEEEGLFGWEGYIDFHSIIRPESCTEKHDK
ncbi:hypothetical protein EDB92DRAFT_1623317 [Lactarius akahatsu]|uniref:F-box domain-containing protein n=1 Tax=Lactarius akahatsu TaxID=416441 RepID=A0AAD4Q9L3_9AGAM|nr:hypothetical protein EDB92DRAFT_1623317 [Lactarius akahatsu]